MLHRISQDHAVVHDIRNALTADRGSLVRVVEAALNIRHPHVLDRLMHVHAAILQVLRINHVLVHEVVQKNRLLVVEVVQKNLYRVAEVDQRNQYRAVAVVLHIPDDLLAALVIRVEQEVAVILVRALISARKNVNEPY